MKSISKQKVRCLTVALVLLIQLLQGKAIDPLFKTIDLNLGEKAVVELTDGSRHIIQALDLRVKTDPVAGAVREMIVVLTIDNNRVLLNSGGYHLPVQLDGIQIDCPVTKALMKTTDQDAWSLEKDIRLRVWPAGSPWITPGTFQYPLEKKLFDSHTQMTNIPVADLTKPGAKRIYYHSGLDFGGCEGVDKVCAATDGYIVSVGLDASEILPSSVATRYDVVNIRDDRGWYYRYSHMKEIDKRLKPGDRIAMGQELGVIGKEGASGGWAHLHFSISSMMPSGKFGNQCAYAFNWEAYQKKYNPDIMAIARPDQIARVGDEVKLDGSRSRSRENFIASYEWTLSDGKRSMTPVASITYHQPGFFSEILKVTDRKGNVDYDIAVVQVYGDNETVLPPYLHAAFSPSQGVKPGDEITFMVRTMRIQAIAEVWDFGDGSAELRTKSAFTPDELNRDPHNPNGYAKITHTYDKPGDYIVTIRSENPSGVFGVARLYVKVSPK